MGLIWFIIWVLFGLIWSKIGQLLLKMNLSFYVWIGVAMFGLDWTEGHGDTITENRFLYGVAGATHSAELCRVFRRAGILNPRR